MDLNIHKMCSAVIPKGVSDKEAIACTLGYAAGFKSVASSKNGLTDVSYADVSKSKTDYAKFVKAAAGSTNSAEYHALYRFLLKCFTDADKDFNGRIEPDEFNDLIERASAVPRRFGLAPQASDIYANDSIRNIARQKMFSAMDEEKTGSIGFESWLGYCYDHIRHKAATIETNPAEAAISRSKTSFINFITAATDRKSAEYHELYLFLLKCFTDADLNMNGSIGIREFSMLVETATVYPRQYGLAPHSGDLFGSQEELMRSRLTMFKTMDVDNDDQISFDEWLTFAFAHICEKVKTL